MAVAKIGQLRERVRIETPTESRDSRGQTQQTWESLVEVWAAVEPLTAQEVWQAREVQVDASERVTIRTNATVALGAPKMRIIVLTQANRILNVEGVERDPGREWLYLNCRTEGRVAA